MSNITGFTFVSCLVQDKTQTPCLTFHPCFPEYNGVPGWLPLASPVSQLPVLHPTSARLESAPHQDLQLSTCLSSVRVSGDEGPGDRERTFLISEKRLLGKRSRVYLLCDELSELPFNKNAIVHAVVVHSYNPSTGEAKAGGFQI